MVGLKTPINNSEVMTKEQCESTVKQLKSDEERWNKLWQEGENKEFVTFNAFSINSPDGTKLINGGAIAFAVIMGLITITSVTLAGISISLFAKNKKATTK